MKLSPNSKRKGFSLAELLVAIPVGLLCAAILFGAVWAGMTLLARNVSINLAHMNALNPIERLTQDIHSAVTQPQLTDTLTSGTFPLVSGSGPAAGVSFELAPLGPFTLFNNTSANDTNIQVDMGTTDESVVKAGMHLCIPSYSVDVAIVSVNDGGNHVNCKIGSAVGVAMSTQTGTGGGSHGSQDIAVYFSNPINYYVAGGQLIRQDGIGNQTIILRNVSTATPFTKPTSDNRFVGVLLGATNPDYSNRKYGSADMLFTTIWIPYRGRLY